MDVKRLIITMLACILSVTSYAHELDKATEKQLFNNYALAMCLATEYKDSDIHDDAIKALNGYREFGNMTLEAYAALNDTYKTWETRPYTAKSGSTLELARCIDFQNSKDVAAIFDMNNPCKDPTTWDSADKFSVRCQ
ncbi:hypothetical protein HWV01_17900 [Moritella sp. 5]|uniref:T6SS amidase immunity protein Tai4 family protein n=1 Tax=Moritella sp. 5 TaxID=2746231 RepID=UPI001BAD58F1|nr:T6SS amidase immunity protein Tai4 family protein [Moritella sp. 5]QUM82019.1 hypothetical protein HWV01_17900 [Moritella sp. 5]